MRLVTVKDSDAGSERETTAEVDTHGKRPGRLGTVASLRLINGCESVGAWFTPKQARRLAAALLRAADAAEREGR